MSIKQEILRYSRQETISPLTPWFDGKLEELIDSNIYVYQNELEDIGAKLLDGLKEYKNKYSISTVAVGMSGGVDSALTAALFKHAGWHVIGVTMPIHQNPEETDRGFETCRALDLEHKHIELTKLYDEVLKSFKSHDKNIDKDALRKGNLRVRLRMMTLYNEASANKGLVGSTDNFSELAAGFWTLHGDVGDLAPIQSLNKSWEVPKLAEIYGVPSSTVFATPTDGLGISKGDEDQFGFSYLEFDIILMHLCNLLSSGKYLKQSLELLAVDQQNKPTVDKILKRISGSSFKRQNPYNLEHPHQKFRYPGLKELDIRLWS